MNAETHAEFIRHFETRHNEMLQVACDHYLGHMATILVNWNGQPYGRSKRNLKGESLLITHVIISGGHLMFLLGDYNLYIDAREVSVL